MRISSQMEFGESGCPHAPAQKFQKYMMASKMDIHFHFGVLPVQ